MQLHDEAVRSWTVPESPLLTKWNVQTKLEMKREKYILRAQPRLCTITASVHSGATSSDHDKLWLLSTKHACSLVVARLDVPMHSCAGATSLKKMAAAGKQELTHWT
jgi:hypothetical protein